MRHKIHAPAAQLVALLTATAPAVEAQTGVTSALQLIHIAAHMAPESDEVLDAYLATLPTDGEVYFVEGDIAVTREEVRYYLEDRVALSRDDRSMTEMVAELKIALDDAGEWAYWKESADRQLLYSVDTESFQAAGADMGLALELLWQATEDWQESCPECGVTFGFVPEDQAGDDHELVKFVLTYSDPGGRPPIARAFFPHQWPARRTLIVFPRFFTTGVDKAGILRHELGHVLGYRHEHIEGIPGCRREENDWVRLTPYDKESVMHYLCGGGGNRALEISKLDIAAHRCLYLEGRTPPCAAAPYPVSP